MNHYCIGLASLGMVDYSAASEAGFSGPETLLRLSTGSSGSHEYAQEFRLDPSSVAVGYRKLMAYSVPLDTRKIVEIGIYKSTTQGYAWKYSKENCFGGPR